MSEAEELLKLQEADPTDYDRHMGKALGIQMPDSWADQDHFNAIGTIDKAFKGPSAVNDVHPAETDGLDDSGALEEPYQPAIRGTRPYMLGRKSVLDDLKTFDSSADTIEAWAERVLMRAQEDRDVSMSLDQDLQVKFHCGRIDAARELKATGQIQEQ